MFPYQLGEKYSSQIFHDFQNENIAEENMILASQDNQTNLTNFVEEGQQPNQTFRASNIKKSNVVLSNDEKKKFRKEIERQRRQQMSTLQTYLRSLLPLDFLKGKRSVSDLLNEAVNYIQHLKNNIGELSAKRDKLKKSSDSTISVEDQGAESWENSMQLSVRSYLDGAEIVVSGDYGEEGFALSRLLEAVVEEGHDIDSYFSTQKDGRLFATIHCMASNDMACIDQVALQQKLKDVILCLKDNAKD